MNTVFDRYWRIRKWLPARYRHRCRVLARGKMNSALIEFETDGYRVITSRNFIRRDVPMNKQKGV